MECVLLSSLCSQFSVVSLLFILKCFILSIYSLLCPSPLILYISQCLSQCLSHCLSQSPSSSLKCFSFALLSILFKIPLSQSLIPFPPSPSMSLLSLVVIPCLSFLVSVLSIYVYIYISSTCPLEY